MHIMGRKRVGEYIRLGKLDLSTINPILISISEYKASISPMVSALMVIIVLMGFVARCRILWTRLTD